MAGPRRIPLLVRAADHEIGNRAAQISFFTLLAIFPGLLTTLGLLSLLHVRDASRTLEALVRRGLPKTTASAILKDVLELGAQSGLALVVSAIFTLYYARQALASVLRGVERAFDTRDTLTSSNRFSFLLTAGLLVTTPALLVVLTLATTFLRMSQSLRLFAQNTVDLVAWLRVPVLFLIFHAFVRFLYEVGSRRRVCASFFSRGALVASLGWLLATHGFELYLTRFSKVSLTYGSVATAVGLLLYMHLVASFLLVGAELDAHRARARV
jgi:membrane protein